MHRLIGEDSLPFVVALAVVVQGNDAVRAAFGIDVHIAGQSEAGGVDAGQDLVDAGYDVEIQAGQKAAQDFQNTLAGLKAAVLGVMRQEMHPPRLKPAD